MTIDEAIGLLLAGRNTAHSVSQWEAIGGMAQMDLTVPFRRAIRRPSRGSSQELPGA